MPTYKFIQWGALAVAAAGSLGCMGGGTSPMGSSASSGNVGPFSQQMASANTATSASAGGSAVAGTAGISQALWNNPVSRAVKGAFGGEVESASHQTATTVRPSDALSLSRPTKPPSPELYTSMAVMAERAGNAEKAREFHEQAISAAPGSADALLAYGHFHDRQGRMDEATRLYRDAIQVDPQHAGAHNDLGLCYARQGHLPQALELVRRAAQMRPDRPIYRNNAAKVLVEMGQSDEAVSELATVLSPAEAQYNVGCFLAQSGRTEQAASHFAKAVQIDPSMQNARAWLAKLQPGTMAASRPAGASTSHVPAARQPTSATSAYNPAATYSASAGAADRSLPLITNVRPVDTNAGYAAGLASLPPASAGAAPQQRTSSAEASSVPPQQTSAWPPNSASQSGPYLDASDERYRVPNPVTTSTWPQDAGTKATAAVNAGGKTPFDGASHGTPWGDVPSPYGRTSHPAGMQYPSTSATAATGTAPRTTSPAAPATVMNPYSANPPAEERIVRQPWSPTMQSMQ